MIYIVTYDLYQGNDARNYKYLLDLIKEEGIWACLGKSSYLIESYCSAEQLRNKFLEALDSRDKIYVGVVTAPAAWNGYSKDVSDWILKNWINI